MASQAKLANQPANKPILWHFNHCLNDSYTIDGHDDEVGIGNDDVVVVGGCGGKTNLPAAMSDRKIMMYCIGVRCWLIAGDIDAYGCCSFFIVIVWPQLHLRHLVDCYCG